MRFLFSILTLITLVVSPAVAQNYTLNAFLKHDGDIEGVAFSEDGRTLASMGTNGILHYWNPHTEKRQPHAEISAIDRWSIDASIVPEEPHTLPVNTFDTIRQAVSFPGVEDPDGLLASGSSDKTIWLQGFPTLRPLFQIQEQGKVWAVALSPDGQTLASAGEFAGIHLWDLTTISPVHGTIELKSTLAASTARVEGLAFSPDGQTLAVATGRSDGEAIHLWDLRTGTIKEKLIAVGVPVRKVAFSPDGQMIAAGADHTFGGRNVLLWKRGPLSPAKIPHSVEIAGSSTVRALAKDFTYTVTVKNVYGRGIENVLVRLDNPQTSVWTHNQSNGAWTDSQGNAVFFLQFRAVGMHDINIKVLHRASRAVTLEKFFERRVEVPKPTSITPVEATLDYILICGSDTQGDYNDAFKVTDATGQPLENFVVHFFVYPNGTSPSSAFTVDASTDDQGQATLWTMISQGTYDVKTEVYDLITPNPWLDGTFPSRITAIQHKTINEYGTIIYTHADGNQTSLIKGLTLEYSLECGEDYTELYPPFDGEHFDLYNQSAPEFRIAGSANTCGSTSAMMLLNYYGVKPTLSSFCEIAEVFSVNSGVYPDEVWRGVNHLLRGHHGKATLYYDRVDNDFLDGVARRIKYFPRAGFGDIPTTKDIFKRGPINFSTTPRETSVKRFLISRISESRPPIVLWEVRPPEGWHYVLVIGYDSKTDSFLIADPNKFYYWLPWNWEGTNTKEIMAKHEDGNYNRDIHSFYRMWAQDLKPGEASFAVSNEPKTPKTAYPISDRWITFGTGIYATDLGKFLTVVPDIAPKYHHLESETFRISQVGHQGWVLFDYDEFERKRKVEGEIVAFGAVSFGVHQKNTNVRVKDNELILTVELKDGWIEVFVDVDRVLRNGTIITLPHRALNFLVQPLYTGFIETYATVYYEPGSSVPTAPSLLSPEPLVRTALLPNYPNPFNPETWIPYQLAKPSDVTLYIHGVDGKLVRKLALGHQDAGAYHSKGRAAYWDGRNAFGERVASGIYFYTIITDDFHATGKMLILK